MCIEEDKVLMYSATSKSNSLYRVAIQQTWEDKSSPGP